MLKLEIYNINELEAPYIEQLRGMLQSKKDYYENLFKKYPKPLLWEVKFNKDKQYRVSINLNLQSKDIRIVETGRDPVETLRRALSEFKKAVKRQLALERKDFLYKRKRYRHQKWKDTGKDAGEYYFAEDIIRDRELVDRINDQMEAGQVDAIISEMMDEEDAGDRKMFQMYFLEQQSADEIAGTLGTTAGEVEEKTGRFRQRVEEKFREQTA